MGKGEGREKVGREEEGGERKGGEGKGRDVKKFKPTCHSHVWCMRVLHNLLPISAARVRSYCQNFITCVTPTYVRTYI